MGINKIMKRGSWKSESTLDSSMIKIINENNLDKLNYEGGVII